MARNVELKVRCDRESRLDEIKRLALAAGAGPFVSQTQTDVYFSTTNGRLKVREIEALDGASAELIGYRRPDTSGSRWSDYERAPLPVESVAAVKRALAATCQVLAVVEKRREVGLLGHTRIHLDVVRDLGAFVELETIVDEASEADAQAEHVSVAWQLGLDALPAVAGSYSDLIVSRRAEEREQR